MIVRSNKQFSMPLQMPNRSVSLLRTISKARSRRIKPPQRSYTTKPPSSTPSTTPPNSASPGSTTPAPNNVATQGARFDRILNRLPKFTRKYVIGLRAKPLSHVSAFLLLHELTAIVPLFGLAGAFHYYDWLPPGFAEGWWVKEGTKRFGNYMRKKGWITEEERKEAIGEVDDGEIVREDGEKKKEGLFRRALGNVTDKDSRSQWWGRGEGGVRLVVEFATAYAVVKFLIIPRVMFSVWGTPWFARRVVEPISSRTVAPVWNRVKRMFGGKKTPKGPPGPPSP